MDLNATIIGQSIAMIVFVWFCMKYIWPPLMDAIEERQTQIADGLAAGEEGKIGFGRGVCMSAVENVEEVTFNDYLFVTPTNDTFTKAWREATSGLII